MNQRGWTAISIAACIATTAFATDRDDYNRRSAERYIAMFRLNDVNGDNAVSRVEASGTLELEARFDDLDEDRDGAITWSELTRFIDATFR